jgi:serine protease Do
MAPYFKRFRPPRPPGGTPVRSQGSGFIVGSEGIILTNAHVVQGAHTVSVKLTDRREFDAKVIGSDPSTDVAVLKIEASQLPTVTLGSSRSLQVGEWVLAIGSPFGFENSVTAGVVSAKGRALPDDSFVPFIQTDVAVNPGNSGGPLFNTRGEVVGINSQIVSQSGGYQGLSFAIPIEVASKVQAQITTGGRARHARLGVAIQEVNQAMADSFRLDKPEGALVSDIDRASPAEASGLKVGDVIRRFNGEPIVASADLSAQIGQSVPGEQVKLEVWRAGRAEQLAVTLGDAGTRQSDPGQAEAMDATGKLGLSLRPLQAAEQRQAGTQGGLLVEQAGGASARAGVAPGDVLLAINGTPLLSVDQARGMVARAGRSVALLILRGKDRIFIPVRLG